MDELFGLLRLAYPNFSRGEDLDAAKRFWAYDLGNFISDEDIKAAMEIMTDEFPARAPTIGQFKQLCRKARKDLPDAKPKLEMTPVCSNCLSDRRSQRHVDICGEV